MLENVPIIVRFLVILAATAPCLSQIGTPPRVEEITLLLDSYIPPTMQILAYLTEMMKYDLKPTTPPPFGLTTTSTIRPTPYHRPAVYAPLKPPGPNTYYQSLQKDAAYKEYVESLKRPSGLDYFDRYKQALESKDEDKYQNEETVKTEGIDESTLENIGKYFGRNFLDTYELVYEVDKEVVNGIEEQSQEFLKKYDDSNFRSELLRQKQVPPTKAYVTLLSLYDMLNKESKRLGLNKYQGYTEKILKELVEISTNTSAYQLQYTLKKIIENRNTNRADIVKKVKLLIGDLDDPDSYINVATKYIPPLVFVS